MFGWGKKRERKNDSAASVESAPQKSALNGNAPDTVASDDDKFQYIVGLQTDVGCVREGNEDNARAVFPETEDERTRLGVLVIVADGMGGHAGGEIASEMAVETVCYEYYAATPEYSSAPSIVLRAALESANAAIYGASRRDKSKRGMGTTCTALVLRGEQAFAAHAGDSRLYLLRAGNIYQLSQDHSAVMEMVRQGMLTAQQARHHENKNLITRALGLHAQVEVDIWDEPLPVRANDRFLLCSDGLSDLLEDELINSLALSAEPQVACETLVEQAKARGGHDNITVAILQVCARGDAENLSAQNCSAEELPVTREVSQPAEVRKGEAAL